MAYVCSLNSTAKIIQEEGKFKRSGEPTEAALIVASEKIGKVLTGANFKDSTMPFYDSLFRRIEKVGVLEFSSERKTMSTVIKGLDLNTANGNSVLLKGAPEKVIEKCSTYKTANGDVKPFDRVEKEELMGQVKLLASKGLRCLASAIIYDGGNLRTLNEDNKHDLLT